MILLSVSLRTRLVLWTVQELNPRDLPQLLQLEKWFRAIHEKRLNLKEKDAFISERKGILNPAALDKEEYREL